MVIGFIWRRNLKFVALYIHCSYYRSYLWYSPRTQTSQQVLSIIAVCLPCSDLGMNYYRECMIDLEDMVEKSKYLGPTIVMGDVNAHISTLGGPRGCGDPNCQGIMLHEFVARSDMFIASLSNHANGPNYGEEILKRLLLDVDDAALMSSCRVHDVDNLNTSDHLPIFVEVNISTSPIDCTIKDLHRTNWTIEPKNWDYFHPIHLQLLS